MSARLEHLRTLAQQAQSDDHSIMTDPEVDELLALERQLESDKAAIRAEARQDAEQRHQQDEKLARQNAAVNRTPYRRRSSSSSTGMEMIRRGLAGQ